jgi:hypothetical protein
MQAVTTIGPDIAKSVFQVHRIDAQGNVIIRRQLRRLVLADGTLEAAGTHEVQFADSLC